MVSGGQKSQPTLAGSSGLGSPTGLPRRQLAPAHLKAQLGKALLPSSRGLLAGLRSPQTVGRGLPSVPRHVDHLIKVHKPISA